MIGYALLQHFTQSVILRQLFERFFVRLRVEKKHAFNLTALFAIHHLLFDAASKKLTLCGLALGKVSWTCEHACAPACVKR